MIDKPLPPSVNRPFFSRANLVEFARTMVWVAPLTILIWVYAEREQISTVSDVPLQLQVHANGAKQVASIAVPQDRSVVLTLEGPRVRLDTLRDQFSTGGRAAQITIELPTDTGTGPITRGIADELNKLPLFRSNGVKVTAASPAQMTVMVDEVVTRELFVSADMSVANFDGVPVFDPPTVRLTGPRSVLDRYTDVDAAGRSVILADLAPLAEVRTPGDHTRSEVALVRPQLLAEVNPAQFSLSPDRVRTAFRIRQADVTFTIPAMPVFPLAAPTFLDEFRAVYEPTVANVTVQGAPDVIAALRAETLEKKPKAILEFSRDDLPPGKTRSRRLRYDLPDGLSVVPEDLKREVEFTLVPRVRTDE